MKRKALFVLMSLAAFSSVLFCNFIDAHHLSEALALSDIVGNTSSFAKVAEYEFKNSSSLNVDSVGNYNLVNSGATYDSSLKGVSFKNSGYLYAPKIDGNKDFSDLIKGSYSVSMNIYTKNTSGDTHWLINASLYEKAFGLSWNYDGYQILGLNGTNDIMSSDNDGTKLFSSTWAWYRIHFIYNDTAKTFRVISTKYNSDQKSVDTSYSFSYQRNIDTSLSSLLFGGHDSYTFTLGAQSQAGLNAANFLSSNSTSPVLKDLRIYSGMINENEMDDIQQYDFNRKLDEEYNLKLDGTAYKNNMVLQREKTLIIEGQAIPNKEVTISFAGQSKKATVDNDGKFSITLDPLEASSTGRNFVVSTNYGKSITYTGVVVGEVFIGMGQSNMAYPIFEFTYVEYLIKNNVGGEWPSYDVSKYNNQASIDSQLSSFTHYNQLRFYQQELKGGLLTPDSRIRYNTWICDNTYPTDVSFTSVAFAVALYEKLNIPVGIIMNAVGGSRIRQWLDDLGKATYGDDNIFYKNMTQPLGCYNARGLLWYQGESDAFYMNDYVNAFKHMLPVWRNLYHDENLPLILYQLVQYKGDSDTGPWGPVRMAHQQIADECENVYMVCGIDTGDYSNIHPIEKMLLNRRAVGIALKEIYHLPYGGSGYYGESPMIVSATRIGNQVTLSFKNATSLVFATGDKLPLKVSNDKSNYTDITSYSVSGNTITFNTDKKYVSYAQDNYFIKNNQYMRGFIYNEYNLPVAPFKDVEICNASQTITINASGCTVDCEAETVVDYNSSLTINITPNEGYILSSATIDGNPVSVVNNQVVINNITSNKIVNIEYSISQYEVNIVTNNGTIEGESSRIVNYNGSTVISTSPNTGYEFDSLYINDEDYSSLYNDGTIVLEGIKESKDIVINYKKIQLTVSISVTGATIDKECSYTVNYNDSTTIKITPLIGYTFSYIKINDENYEYDGSGSITISNIQKDVDVEIVYSINKHSVSLAGDYFAVNGNRNRVIDYNDSTTYNVIIDEGYEFSSLFINGVDCSNLYNNGSFTISNVQENKNIILNVSLKKINIVVNVSGASINKNTNFEVDYGSSFAINITPNEGFIFASATINGEQVDVDNNQLLVENVTSSKEISIEYVISKFNVNIIAPNGVINGEFNRIIDYNGSTTINVAPNEGYEFSSLFINDEDYSSLYDNGAITISNILENKNILVNYSIKTYIVNITCNGATTDKDNSYSVQYNGSTNIKINPLDGYSYSSITINDETFNYNQNGYLLINNIKENKNIVISYLINNYDINLSGYHFTIEGEANRNVEYNGSTTYNVSLDDGYEFGSLYINNFNCSTLFIDNQFTISNVQENKNITLIVISKKVDVSVFVTNATIDKNDNFKVNYNSSLTINITPNEGYILSSATIDGNPVSVVNNQVVINNITSNKIVNIEYSISQYEVNIVTNNGTIEGESSRIVNYNGSTVISTSPNTGYEFDSLYINDEDYSSLYNDGTIVLEGIKESKDIVINYKKIQLTVSISVTGATIDKECSFKVNYGDNLLITISPQNGYEFDKITASKEYVFDSDILSVEDITEDLSLDISYKIIPILTCRVTIIVHLNDQTNNSERIINIGETITISLIKEDYELQSLKVNGVGVQQAGDNFEMTPTEDTRIDIYYGFYEEEETTSITSEIESEQADIPEQKNTGCMGNINGNIFVLAIVSLGICSLYIIKKKYN